MMDWLFSLVSLIPLLASDVADPSKELLPPRSQFFELFVIGNRENGSKLTTNQHWCCVNGKRAMGNKAYLSKKLCAY